MWGCDVEKTQKVVLLLVILLNLVLQPVEDWQTLEAQQLLFPRRLHESAKSLILIINWNKQLGLNLIPKGLWLPRDPSESK